MAIPPSEPRTRPSAEAQRNARHSYLIGRLRSRQITMEEATELFGAMQEMIRASEAARLAAVAQTAPPAIAGGPAKPHAPARPAPPSGSDDMFLVGLLAMGAGAGLLAALTKRISEGTPTTSASSRPRDTVERSTR
jgi:hypothetical protein